ncbi:MAG: hypothetical protein ABIH72_05335 [archaeon]
MKNKYKALVGCYGGRRGTTLAAIAQTRIDELAHLGELEITAEGMGHPDYIGNKENHPIEDKHIQALEESIGRYNLDIEALRNTGRKASTREKLRQADKVYAVDTHILGEYQKQAGQRKGRKYKTVLEGTKFTHKVYGKDMDDTEVPNDFVNRVVIPKKQGKTPEDLKPADARYYSMNGWEYRAGDKAARDQEAHELIVQGRKLGERIWADAYSGIRRLKYLNYEKWSAYVQESDNKVRARCREYTERGQNE